MSKIVKPYSFAKMKDVDSFVKTMSDTGINLPCSEDLSILKDTVDIYGHTVSNRLCVHPCEGFDGTFNGRPTEILRERYASYAKGGSGMLWYEAIAVSEDGRGNPKQLLITDETVEDLKKLVDDTNAIAIKSRGVRPYNIIQLTHSGRSSKGLNWNPKPLVAVSNPYQDGVFTNLKIATDERIEELRDEMIHAAELSLEAGFDAIDIKICHNYLMRELLAGFTRPGKYGGSYENRTRFLFEVINGIREKVGHKIEICARINAYDCLPYPYGWGMVKEEGVLEYDLEEPIRLIKELVAMGINLFNVSTMMPRFSPRNMGFADLRNPDIELNPYESTALLLQATKEIKDAVPDAILVATGLSWFDKFGANVGAGGINDSWFDIAGFGRQVIAYPDYASDIIDHGYMLHEKCCVTCDKCYALSGLHEDVGCVARNPKYRAIYQNAMKKKKEVEKI